MYHQYSQCYDLYQLSGITQRLLSSPWRIQSERAARAQLPKRKPAMNRLQHEALSNY